MPWNENAEITSRRASTILEILFLLSKERRCMFVLFYSLFNIYCKVQVCHHLNSWHNYPVGEFLWPFKAQDFSGGFATSSQLEFSCGFWNCCLTVPRCTNIGPWNSSTILDSRFHLVSIFFAGKSCADLEAGHWLHSVHDQKERKNPEWHWWPKETEYRLGTAKWGPFFYKI